MHIAIDARMYGATYRGIGVYIQQLIAHLERLPSDHEFTILMHDRTFDAYTPRNPRFSKKVLPFSWYSIEEQLTMPAYLHRHFSFDLLHVPHFNVPILTRIPTVITLHDLILRDMPTSQASQLPRPLFWAKYYAYRATVWSALARARRIITISQSTYTKIAQYYPSQLPKTDVIYSGLGALPEASPDTRPLNIPSSYILALGAAYPHKNLRRLIDAYDELCISTPSAPPLVIAGTLDAPMQAMQAYAHSKQSAPAIYFPGFIEPTQIADLYAHALVFVYPSLIEGFGFPPLEALRAGVPCACSDIPALREALGSHAHYFNPYDSHAIMNTLSTLIREKTARDALLQNVPAHLSRYSWDTCARLTLDCYQKSLSHASHPSLEEINSSSPRIT